MTYLHCPDCRLTVQASAVRGRECPRCQGELAERPGSLFGRLPRGVSSTSTGTRSSPTSPTIAPARPGAAGGGTEVNVTGM
jgi:hypothetical protein